MVINMNKRMYFKIDKIPDLSLNKYSSLSETGIDGILERHTSFLRQWHRIAALGKISMHLIISYDPQKNNGQKLNIGFLVDSQNDDTYLTTVEKAFSSSPLSEFFEFYRNDNEIEELEKIEYKNLSVASKSERFIYPSVKQDSPPFFYVVPTWEMQDKSRLYNMLKLMKSFDVKCEFRLDMYSDNIGKVMHENLKKPLHWLRNNVNPDMHVNIINERQEVETDSAINEVLKHYEELLEKFDTSPSFYAHIAMLCNDEKIGQILLESATSEAIKSRYDKITTFKGNFNGLSYYKNIDLGVCSSNAPDALRLLPITFTLEELDSYFRFPSLYEGETVEISKETAPTLIDNTGIFMGKETNGYDVYLPINLLRKHMFVCGVPGAGKTNTMLRIASTLWKEHKIPFLVLEPAKKEYRELSLFDIEDLIIFSPNANTKFPLRINPFEFPIGLTLSEHITALDSVFEGAFPLAPPTPFLLDQSIENIYIEKGWNTDDVNDGTKPYPTLSELYVQFEKVLEKTTYEGEIKGNIRSALQMRIGSLLRREMADIFDTPKSSLTPEEWMNNPIIIELESLGEGPRNFTNLFLCTLIRENLKVNPTADKERTLRHVIMIEEAHNLIASTTQNQQNGDIDPKVSATAFIVKMLAEVRALREGIIIADQLPTAMAPEVIKNTNIKLVHRLTSQDDRGLVGSTMSANDIQIEKMATYSPGQSLIVYEGLLKPYEMMVKELKVHAKNTPNDNDLYEIMLKKKGFKNQLEKDYVYIYKLIKSLIAEYQVFVYKELEYICSLNFEKMNREQIMDTLLSLTKINKKISIRKTDLKFKIEHFSKKCPIYSIDILNRHFKEIDTIETKFKNSYNDYLNIYKYL